MDSANPDEPQQKLPGALDRYRYRAKVRSKQALEMRLAGVRYDKIADALGYATPSGAYLAVKREMARIPREPAREALEQDLQRVEEALLAIWPQVKSGVLGSVDRFVKLMRLRAEYLGLFAPTKIALTDPTGAQEWTGKSDSELIGEFERLMEQARERVAQHESGEAT